MMSVISWSDVCRDLAFECAWNCLAVGTAPHACTCLPVELCLQTVDVIINMRCFTVPIMLSVNSLCSGPRHFTVTWSFLPHAVNCGMFCFWHCQSVVFGRPFVKQFVYAIGPLSCLSVCTVSPVCNVGVLWPNGWMDGSRWKSFRTMSIVATVAHLSYCWALVFCLCMKYLRNCWKRFMPNSYGCCVWSVAWKSPGTKRAFFGAFGGLQAVCLVKHLWPLVKNFF